MLVIEYIKIFGALVSFYLVIRYKRQHLRQWIRIGRYEINYADLMLGYFVSTLVCSSVYWPNISTYAVWSYYGAAIAIVATYKMLVWKRCRNKYVITLNLLILAEFIAILTDELYWEWQLTIIAAGLISSLVSSLVIACCRYCIKRF
ncbi:MAG: hypothetical protein NC548_27905 [Lachnospiraceae bacterium]|nr:hypothetical protein [Lachnospiraceae bacterium]